MFANYISLRPLESKHKDKEVVNNWDLVLVHGSPTFLCSLRDDNVAIVAVHTAFKDVCSLICSPISLPSLSEWWDLSLGKQQHLLLLLLWLCRNRIKSQKALSFCFKACSSEAEVTNVSRNKLLVHGNKSPTKEKPPEQTPPHLPQEQTKKSTAKQKKKSNVYLQKNQTR